jgi:hypothetical protein
VSDRSMAATNRIGEASWMTDQRLDEMRKVLPDVAWRRLFLNEWCSSGGDAIESADIEYAFKPDLKPMTGSDSSPSRHV